MIRRVSVDNNVTPTYAYGQSTQVGRICWNLLAYTLNVYIPLTLSYHGDQVTEPNKHNLIRTKSIYQHEQAWKYIVEPLLHEAIHGMGLFNLHKLSSNLALYSVNFQGSALSRLT